MKGLTIVGARSQFLKAAPINQIPRRDHMECLMHTGQRYDNELLAVFLEELDVANHRYLTSQLRPISRDGQPSGQYVSLPEQLVHDVSDRPE